MFPCREKDYLKFYPTDLKSRSKLERIKSDPNKKLYCIDWEEVDIELFGLESTGDFAYLDIAVVPCN